LSVGQLLQAGNRLLVMLLGRDGLPRLGGAPLL
jgi:hypothetical protein